MTFGQSNTVHVSNPRRFTSRDEDREMVEAGFFYRVVEAVDIVAEENVTGKKSLESIGDLPKQ